MDSIQEITAQDVLKAVAFERTEDFSVIMVTTDSCPKCVAIKKKITTDGIKTGPRWPKAMLVYEFDGNDDIAAKMIEWEMYSAPSFIIINNRNRTVTVHTDAPTAEELQDIFV